MKDIFTPYSREVLRAPRAMLVVSLLLCSFCLVACNDVFNNTATRDELARRAQCRANMLQIGKAIADYHRQHSEWPTSLSDVRLSPMPACRSAKCGNANTQLSGVYEWNFTNHILSESPMNHNVGRLGIADLSNVMHVVSFENGLPTIFER